MTESSRPPALRAWHAVVDSGDAALLDGLLADEVVFRSPAVFTPAEGKIATTAYLTAALHVLGPSLRYVHELYDGSSAVLEFEADLDGTFVHGVDLMSWNDDAQLISFTVMVRPLRGLQQLIALMGARLTSGRDIRPTPHVRE